MNSRSKLYLERAENELNLGTILFQLSEDNCLQKQFQVSKLDTYYSAVISHSYYSIFYATKAHLTKKNIKTNAPEEHRKTYEQFKLLVETGVIDLELLKIYQNAMIKADYLVGILSYEKSKRGRFTYKTLPQANQEPASNSLKNATSFFKHMTNLCS
ncbi:hypothetical protein HN615_07880 [Candidatus Woesearchaeota archaeon]|jgi:uncharacterized protein (UPF0332 family)|nr:hypothetical protein [Candidatus Woesearchaeota archaeon]MBT7556830.1 hypothetical protein [Candidatus Woesearchaeota archaeon]